MWLAIVVALSVFLIAAGAATQAAEYRVGVARVDVTPNYPIRLNGFGFRRTESEGVYQTIWAKALAIQHGDDPPVLLVTLDNLGIRESMVHEVAERLSRSHAITRRQIAVAFSHSHTTPKVRGASDTIFSTPIPPEHQERIDRYTSELTDALEQVCRAALEDLRPSRLAWGVGKVTFAKNRRPAGGPVDHSLPVLAVYDEEGELRAVLVTYACHCVTLSWNRIGGDWAGYAQEIIERKWPGTTALVSIGCGSDANPSSGVTGDKVDVAVGQGQEIADEVARVLEGQLRPVQGPVTARLTHVSLPLEPPPNKEQLATLAQQSTPAGYNARFQLERLERGEMLPEAIAYPVQTFCFGSSLEMVFLAGEVCVDYALRLRKELAAERLWIHGYSNDFCAYIPSERLLQEGGYGGGSEIVYFALPSRFRPGLEQLIIDAVKQVTPVEFWAAAPNPTKGTQGVPPKSPEESPHCFRLDARFRIELVAAEPLVTDPVAIDFAADGRLWVVEMPDYSREVDEDFTPSGRVKRLEDQDGDGRYDTATVFLEGLRFPTGVTVWRDGVLVCDAPDILFACDHNGDGKADVVTKLYSGFATHNPHARVNSLRYGVDGWVYGSGGLFGGEISSHSGRHVVLERQDFRIRPDTGEIEPASGVTQQGRCRDDWDNWFGCDNSNLGRHYPLVDHYVKRNPFVQIPSTQVSLAADQEAARLYPPGPLVTFKLSGPPGRATSACGLEIYRDTWLGDDLSGNVFTCEPVHQCVHRMVINRQGAVFQGRRAAEETAREFLSSTDQWFRPVQVRTGPDGALWIVDMYRYVIEHKRWIPEESLEQLDLFAGRDRGRIYRVVRADVEPPRLPNLAQLSGSALAEQLDHPNGTRRDLVQQLLLWEPTPEAVPALERIVRHGSHPAARLQALWTLYLWRSLRKSLLMDALGDEHPSVRRHALRVAESFAQDDEVAAAMGRLSGDEAYEVRYQAAYSLGSCAAAQAAPALARLLRRHADDAYLVAAALSSIHSANVAEVVEAWKATDPADSQTPHPVFAQLVSMMVLWQGKSAIASAAEHLLAGHRPQAEARYFHVLRTFIEAVERVEGGKNLLQQLPQFTTWIDTARWVLSDTDAAAATKQAAMALLGSWADGRDIQTLLAYVHVQQPPILQRAALDALARMDSPEIAQLLIDYLSRVSPTMQSEVVDVLLRRPPWTRLFLEAMEQGRVSPSVLDLNRRQRLLSHPQADVRQRAERLLHSSLTNRQAVLDAYIAALNMAGDRQQGQILFGKHCAGCHRWGETGHAVGPDLSALAVKSPWYLLTAILDPNREIEPRFISYIVVTQQGHTFTGLLTEESATTVTLVEEENKTRRILKSDIDELRATGKSFMPEGLEKEMSVEQMAHLLAFLVQVPVQPKSFPGNQPAVVTPDGQGHFQLTAERAEIYGREIRYEPPFRNIGYWHDVQDHVLWRLAVRETGAYELWIEWACDDRSAGNTLLIEGLDRLVSWTVPGTGGWAHYRRELLGRVTLEAGERWILARPSQTFRGPALMDLRGLTLTPVRP